MFNKNKTLFERLIRNGNSFLIVWILSSLSSLIFLKNNYVSIFYLIATWFLTAHILYGGFVIFRDEEEIKLSYTLPGLITAVITFSLLPLFINNAPIWFFCLMIIFLFALMFHKFAGDATRKINLKKFCTEKIKIEIGGGIFSLMGIILTVLFKDSVVIAGLNLIVIIAINVKMLVISPVYRHVNG